MNDDSELLRRYADSRAEDAFAEIVSRHLDFVYSAALRQVNGDAHLASDVAQIVFADLARKAGGVATHRVLAGWLFTSTRFTAAKLIRGERRRHAREQEAHLMQELSEPAAQADWQRVRPVLDDAIGELSENDREAILLRFFEGRDYATVGARLNLAQNAARMRVERALDKLRSRLERRGVTSTSAALATALAHQAVLAAPAGLAATVTGAALAGGSVGLGVAAGAGGAAAVGGFMSMTKLQLAASGALAAAAATGLVIQASQNAQLQQEIARLRTENAAIVSLQSENQQLARASVEAANMRSDDAEFARLQQDADGLKKRLQNVARAEQSRVASRTGATVFDISQLDRTPTPRFQRRPQYPADMRQAGISGEVVVDFIVDLNGQVKDVKALRSSRVEFEAAAIEAVSAWQFNAGQKGGRPVNTHLQVPIVFTLSDDSAPTQRSGQSSPPRAASGRLAEGAAEPKSDVTRMEPFTTMSTRGATGTP